LPAVHSPRTAPSPGRLGQIGGGAQPVAGAIDHQTGAETFGVQAGPLFRAAIAPDRALPAGQVKDDMFALPQLQMRGDFLGFQARRQRLARIVPCCLGQCQRQPVRKTPEAAAFVTDLAALAALAFDPGVCLCRDLVGKMRPQDVIAKQAAKNQTSQNQIAHGLRIAAPLPVVRGANCQGRLVRPPALP
jgi:hypothetical protein